jgi:hypothetical protein
MPAFMHGSPILLVMGLAPLPILLFWMFRVRLAKTYRTDMAAA